MIYPIPEGVLERHIAILGINGSGKTSVAKAVIAEPLLAHKQRIAVIDPTGVWHGLRLKADGKTPAFDVAIFGGPHGDMPLNSHSGKTVAEAIGTSATPVVLDTIAMTVRERSQFFTDFAETLLRVNKGPINLIIDECHLFMPQGGAKAGGQVPDMLHAGNNLVSLGRSRGIRVTMITQRPAKLHKDSLTQALTLIALQVVHPLDRQAVEEWIKDNAGKELSQEIVSSLGGLKAGEGWIWSPRIDLLKRSQFPMPKTLDTSSGDETEIVLPAINIDAIKAKLGRVADEAKANDPRTLKAEIATLKKQVATAPKETVLANKADMDRAHALGVMEGEAKGYELGWKRGAQAERAVYHRLAMAVEGAARDIVNQSSHELPSVTDQPPQLPVQNGARNMRPIIPPSRKCETPAKASAFPKSAAQHKHSAQISDSPIGAERRPLAALASVYPSGMTEAQWAIAAGLKRSGGTWSTYLSRLRTAGRMERRGDLYFVTEQGIADLGENIPTMPPPGEALVKFWISKIPGIGPMLNELAAAYPAPIAREDLAAALNLAASGGTFSTYLSRLRGPGLIETQDGYVRASDALMVG